MYTKDKEIVDTLVRNPQIAKKFRGRLDEIPKKSCKPFSSSLVPKGYKSKDKFAQKNIEKVKDLIRRIGEGQDFEEVFRCLATDGDALHWYMIQQAADRNVDWMRVAGDWMRAESWVGIEIILNEPGSMITGVSLFGTVDEILAKTSGISKVTHENDEVSMVKAYLDGLGWVSKNIIVVDASKMLGVSPESLKNRMWHWKKVNVTDVSKGLFCKKNVNDTWEYCFLG